MLLRCVVVENEVVVVVAMFDADGCDWMSLGGTPTT